MDFPKQKAVFSAIIVVLAFGAAAGFLIWRDVKNSRSPVLETEPDSGKVLDTEPGSGQNANPGNNAVTAAEPQVPDLDRPIKISANLSEEARKKAILDIQEISGMLKGNHDYFDGWLQLGILRKIIGDYNGAIDAWNFAGVIRPKSTIPFANLADLYAFYIRDNKKAEDSFLRAISADPQNGFTYFQTARFYEEILQDMAKAKEILRQGISAGADSSGDLQSLLNSL